MIVQSGALRTLRTWKRSLSSSSSNKASFLALLLPRRGLPPAVSPLGIAHVTVEGQAASTNTCDRNERDRRVGASERASECGREREHRERREGDTKEKTNEPRRAKRRQRSENHGRLTDRQCVHRCRGCFRRSADRRALTGEKTTICATFVFGKYSNARRNASYLMKKTNKHNIDYSMRHSLLVYVLYEESFLASYIPVGRTPPTAEGRGGRGGASDVQLG